MLTLDPNSSCDVCAEEYGLNNLPSSIPCGHVLCNHCSETICEKASPRQPSLCPFCREPFTADSIRVIRVDCSSRASTPRPNLALEIPEETILWERREDDRALPFDSDAARIRGEVRVLEDKVAKVASKKCSVEELYTLHKELQDWLTAEGNKNSDVQPVSLLLSAALLRAILMNHLAHSEAIKMAKGVETNLRLRLDDGDKFENELKKQKALLAQKTAECQHLRAELSRFKVNGTASSLGLATTPTTPYTSSRRASVSTSTPTSPDHAPMLTSTPSTPASTTMHSPSPLSRFSSQHTHTHTRTASLSMSSRSSTPTPTLHHRSMTPGPGHSRSMTPAPPLPQRSATPALPISASRAHAHGGGSSAPPVPPKPRTLSSTPPGGGSFSARGPVDDRERDHHSHSKDSHHREREHRDREHRSSGRETPHQVWHPSQEVEQRSGSGRTSRAGQRHVSMSAAMRGLGLGGSRTLASATTSN
ncbi:hypothetical protein BD410DRAFT_805110 [Rickenella mellea]|uniref:RING-type domain-containing protein n=1 Tax=Rickenella mellea TaxID=50990 RepID=A0A4Y7PYU9_9AGAM|nr:hypothetical protein BD410DRAFT_805110 [Rickenella mellea]